ncbi:MAG TPA: hypothetical protein VL793_05620, partial [Patescibacteria group bacterium]|nr:hypothetical protein [Patescibacteria group bacterium]
MKLHEHEEFLQELLDHETMAALRQESLQACLTSLRRKRRRQILARWSLFMSVPLLVGMLFFLNRFDSRHLTMPLGPTRLVSSAAAPDREVKIINDQELFALFPNRPIALVGKPGHQRLVFLDQ